MRITINSKLDENLKAIAIRHGFTFGDRPSPTALIEAIAAGELKIENRQVRSIAADQVLEKIENCQPFRLSYLDATGKAFVFDCTYAQISHYEGREYLEVRFINQVESDSPPPLDKNRCLRLDRIPAESRIIDIEENWESQLNQIEVRFELQGDLAYSYSKQAADSVLPIENGVIVTRQISNDFWFLRQALRYGSSCTILSPAVLRQKMIFCLQKMTKAYA